eukprot:5644981-Heterocapsa_arctica.AAC.1
MAARRRRQDAAGPRAPGAGPEGSTSRGPHESYRRRCAVPRSRCCRGRLRRVRPQPDPPRPRGG